MVEEEDENALPEELEYHSSGDMARVRLEHLDDTNMYLCGSTNLRPIYGRYSAAAWGRSKVKSRNVKT
jgi:hypothetical protein